MVYSNPADVSKNENTRHTGSMDRTGVPSDGRSRGWVIIWSALEQVRVGRAFPQYIYTATPSGNVGQYQYYLNDHLGNTRVVVTDSGKVLQRTDYYAFGLQIPLTPSTSDSTRLANKYLYNGKELQPETGLLDYGARQYGAAEGRWFGVDPLAEKMPFAAPYSYVFNNPLKYTDPTGMIPSTHTDQEGNVLAVYNDGDKGVYRHDKAQNKADIDKKHSNTNTSAGGTKMGETLHMFSFANHGAYNRSNGRNIIAAVGAKIDFGSTWAHDQVSNILNEHPTAIGYAFKARGGKEWDIKKHTPWARSEMFGSIIGQGANGIDIYASARDAGNFAAGAVADQSYIPTGAILNGFGAYNLGNNNVWKSALIYATMGNLLGAIPTHGEDPLSYKAIESGIKNRINYFWNTIGEPKK